MIYSLLLCIVGMAFAAIAITDIKRASLLLIGLLPTYLLRFSVGPLPTTLLEVLFLLLAVVWLIKHRGDKTLTLSHHRPWILPALLFIAASSFAVSVAPDTFGALGIYKAYFIEPVLLFLLLRNVFTKEDLPKLFNVLAISTSVIAIIAIMQYLTGFGIPIPWDIERRVTSIFPYPNAVGLFLAPIVSALTVMLWQQKKWQLFVPVLLSFVAIIIAQTEAALVAIPAALAATALLAERSRRSQLFIAGISIIALITAFAIPVTRQKLLLQDYSGQVRLSQWAETWELIKDHPLLGVGLNTYPQALEPYHDPTLYEIFQYPHTLLFNIWVELGLLGLLAFFWMALLVLKHVYQHRDNTIILAAFAGLLTMTIHGLVDVPYFKNDLAMLTWALLAILTMATRTKRTA